MRQNTVLAGFTAANPASRHTHTMCLVVLQIAVFREVATGSRSWRQYNAYCRHALRESWPVSLPAFLVSSSLIRPGTSARDVVAPNSPLPHLLPLCRQRSALGCVH